MREGVLRTRITVAHGVRASIHREVEFHFGMLTSMPTRLVLLLLPVWYPLIDIASSGGALLLNRGRSICGDEFLARFRNNLVAT